MVTCLPNTRLELTSDYILVSHPDTKGEKRVLEAMLCLIEPLIECHSGKPQGAEWIKLSRTQVRLR